jgi:hypothetical protein
VDKCRADELADRISFLEECRAEFAGWPEHVRTHPEVEWEDEHLAHRIVELRAELQRLLGGATIAP